MSRKFKYQETCFILLHTLHFLSRYCGKFHGSPNYTQTEGFDLSVYFESDKRRNGRGGQCIAECVKGVNEEYEEEYNYYNYNYGNYDYSGDYYGDYYGDYNYTYPDLATLFNFTTPPPRVDKGNIMK